MEKAKSVALEHVNGRVTATEFQDEEGYYEVEVTKDDAKRWIVERTFSWLIRNRRLSKDYERLVQTSETFIEVAMIRLILRRLARGA